MLPALFWALTVPQPTHLANERVAVSRCQVEYILARQAGSDDGALGIDQFFGVLPGLNGKVDLFPEEGLVELHRAP